MISADLDHFKIFLADPAFGTDEIRGDVFPLCTGRNVLFVTAFSFVVYPTAYDTLPLSHSFVDPSAREKGGRL